jgi:sugar phosphate isomerase/epimerase
MADPSWAVTLFSFTNTLLEARQSPDEVLAAALDAGLSRRIEIDAPQHFRSFPRMDAGDLDKTRAVLERYDTSMTVLGCYLDYAVAPGVLLPHDECVDQLERQIRAAQRLGAWGVRVGLGLVPEPVLTALVPTLEAAGIVWVEEVQGSWRPDAEGLHRRLDLVTRLASEHVRFLFDLSLCMPALPTSYIEALRRHGAAPALVDRLEDAWQGADPQEISALLSPAVAAAQSPPLASLFVTALTRFGRTTVADWRWFVPHVAAVHLKYWDLDDRNGVISTPMRDLRTALADIGFTGTFCSEWGGHEWMSGVDPVAMTAGHRRLFESAAPYVSN